MPTFYKTTPISDKESIRNALLKAIELQGKQEECTVIITEENIDSITKDINELLESSGNAIQEFTMQLASKLGLQKPIILQCLVDLERATLLVKNGKPGYTELDGLEFIICALYEARITKDYLRKTK